MTKKTYLRFLFVGIMLLMSVFLISPVPNPQAAVPDACEECTAACQENYQDCIALHGSFCNTYRVQCNMACSHNQCAGE
jgi:hypothetical protein